MSVAGTNMENTHTRISSNHLSWICMGMFYAAVTRTSSTTPGSQRTVIVIGRQQTAQSSIDSQRELVVSTSMKNVSPHCGQAMSISSTISILVDYHLKTRRISP